ncbi:Helix-turn-helix [Reichenbachiella faecimaris]|uniref:Helix-turn-helix n=1 Tax=Reichenbachiella faecimaris TaxID=692418 RepID=A0A1W2GNV9_REIFA|nr:helix-turn-helix transcriptional regulator [Reichenbachiella faecimaris]SMD38333.1 Helix-turn-helix [Reichenbachiella faecimaris]
METFGEYIRYLREEHKMPLRKLAAFLDIDQSTLSKIERNERHPIKEMVIKLSEVFQLDCNQLTIRFLSDKITYELKDEELGIEALKVAEEQIKYLKTTKANSHG